MERPTVLEHEMFWKHFGVEKVRVYEQGLGWVWVYPPVCLESLFNCVVPRLSSKGDVRFRMGYPFLNTLRCEVWTHLPNGHVQQYVYDLHGVPSFSDVYCALALFWAVKDAEVEVLLDNVKPLEEVSK